MLEVTDRLEPQRGASSSSKPRRWLRWLSVAALVAVLAGCLVVMFTPMEPVETVRRQCLGARGCWIDAGKEFAGGLLQGAAWPAGLASRGAEMARGGRPFAGYDFGEGCRYLFFPYRLNTFTMLRLAGVALAVTAIGYLLCWLGTKPRLGWLTNLGLVYYLYLIAITLYVITLEVVV